MAKAGLRTFTKKPLHLAIHYKDEKNDLATVVWFNFAYVMVK